MAVVKIMGSIIKVFENADGRREVRRDKEYRLLRVNAHRAVSQSPDSFINGIMRGIMAHALELGYSPEHAITVGFVCNDSESTALLPIHDINYAERD